MVEIHLRMGQNSHLVTAIGRVTQVDPDHPNRVKTNNCRKKFHKVLKIITCHSTSYGIFQDKYYIILRKIYAIRLNLISFLYIGDLTVKFKTIF